MKKKFKKLKKIRGANDGVCSVKKFYPDTDTAWHWAEFFYVLEGYLSIPYRCPSTHKSKKEHYHLTSSVYGDGTHIPEEYRELFATSTQEAEEGLLYKIMRFLR